MKEGEYLLSRSGPPLLHQAQLCASPAGWLCRPHLCPPPAACIVGLKSWSCTHLEQRLLQACQHPIKSRGLQQLGPADQSVLSQGLYCNYHQGPLIRTPAGRRKLTACQDALAQLDTHTEVTISEHMHAIGQGALCSLRRQFCISQVAPYQSLPDGGLLKLSPHRLRWSLYPQLCSQAPPGMGRAQMLVGQRAVRAARACSPPARAQLEPCPKHSQFKGAPQVTGLSQRHEVACENELSHTETSSAGIIYPTQHIQPVAEMEDLAMLQQQAHVRCPIAASMQRCCVGKDCGTDIGDVPHLGPEELAWEWRSPRLWGRPWGRPLCLPRRPLLTLCWCMRCCCFCCVKMLPFKIPMQACKGLRSLSIAGHSARMKELLLFWTLLPCRTHLALSDGQYPGLLLIDHELGF